MYVKRAVVETRFRGVAGLVVRGGSGLRPNGWSWAARSDVRMLASITGLPSEMLFGAQVFALPEFARVDPDRMGMSDAATFGMISDGFRLCGVCLVERPGVWLTEWRSPFLFACVKHRRVLGERSHSGLRLSAVPNEPGLVERVVLVQEAVNAHRLADPGLVGSASKLWRSAMRSPRAVCRADLPVITPVGSQGTAKAGWQLWGSTWYTAMVMSRLVFGCHLDDVK
jgi:hypothetical protein